MLSATLANLATTSHLSAERTRGGLVKLEISPRAYTEFIVVINSTSQDAHPSLAERGLGRENAAATSQGQTCPGKTREGKLRVYVVARR